MKKLALLLCACLGCGLLGQAQITTGENTAQTIRTGNRAEAGDFGLYLGATTTHFKEIGDKNTKFAALPLINFKYMTSDKCEMRLGFEWWSSTSSSSSEYNDKTAKSSSRTTSIMFYPGIAYHFNRSNLLDVYVGAELPIGGGANASAAKFGGEKIEDQTYSANRFEIGVGAFVGLQAYICNLPLAVGLEYGFNVRNRHISNGTFKNGDYTFSNINYAEDASSNSFVLGNQARLTVTYFFKL